MLNIVPHSLRFMTLSFLAIGFIFIFINLQHAHAFPMGSIRHVQMAIAQKVEKITSLNAVRNLRRNLLYIDTTLEECACEQLNIPYPGTCWYFTPDDGANACASRNCGDPYHCIDDDPTNIQRCYRKQITTMTSSNGDGTCSTTTLDYDKFIYAPL